MPEENHQRVSCPSCGKGYRWQPSLTGRAVPCKQCGAEFEVPDAPGVGVALNEAPPGESGVYDLAAPEAQEPTRQLAAPARDGKCPNCNSKVKDHAVICINCGFNMQQGRAMDKPAVSELSQKDRKQSERNAKAPIRGMALVRTGLWLNLASIVLIVLAVPMGIVAAIAGKDFDLVINALAYLSLGSAMVGSALCFAAPGEIRFGRLILALSIVLSLISTIIVWKTDGGSMDDGFTILADLMGIAGTACFLYFFVLLARYLDFSEITERAEKVLGLYVTVQLGFYLMLLPLIGCFLAIPLLIAAVYTLWLYVTLLIDLNNALSYRIGEQKAEHAFD